ncbi:hypothetical protein HB662_19785 [Roseomonas frigidaquae]|uniref:Uncharacterized protein n=1 Tax=Falsiroseomonas frigidaquae TaxID=487318 RepID=A0ABX1F3U1_9PROT|nr:hypothetical protein [Falsiroseomonas frigidaquae]NKE47031.1 hypothetical protein [Falsiroseomonas frigidaquae]
MEVNRDGGDLEPEDCPLTQRYLKALAAVRHAVEPQSIAGILALAQSVVAEAQQDPRHAESGHDVPAEWGGHALNILKALLRLAGPPSARRST